jgi:hypothetical protein
MVYTNDKKLSVSLSGSCASTGETEIKWFVDAKVNITKNCIDRHLAKKGDKTAIIFEPNDPSEEGIAYLY